MVTLLLQFYTSNAKEGREEYCCLVLKYFSAFEDKIRQNRGINYSEKMIQEKEKVTWGQNFVT